MNSFRAVIHRVIRLSTVLGVVGVARMATGQPTTSPTEHPSASSPWLVDANAGLPVLRSFDQYQFAGDLTLGYFRPQWGVVATGSGAAYNLDKGAAQSDLYRGMGAFEGWFLTAPGSARFELRLTAGVSNYTSTTLDARTSSVTFYDEDSFLLRGSLLVGARLRPTDAWRISLLAGGGYQFETYGYTNYDTTKVTTAAVSDTDQNTYRLEGRLQIRWQVAPDLFSFRLRSDVAYFSLLRSNELSSIALGQVTTTSSATKSSQIEASARLFGQLDKLAFFGIAPQVFGGVDALSVSGDVTVTSVVPIFGLGLFKSDL